MKEGRAAEVGLEYYDLPFQSHEKPAGPQSKVSKLTQRMVLVSASSLGGSGHKASGRHAPRWRQGWRQCGRIAPQAPAAQKPQPDARCGSAPPSSFPQRPAADSKGCIKPTSVRRQRTPFRQRHAVTVRRGIVCNLVAGLAAIVSLYMPMDRRQLAGACISRM